MAMTDYLPAGPAGAGLFTILSILNLRGSLAGRNSHASGGCPTSALSGQRAFVFAPRILPAQGLVSDPPAMIAAVILSIKTCVASYICNELGPIGFMLDSAADCGSRPASHWSSVARF
jgi:hypothetical protein